MVTVQLAPYGACTSQVWVPPLAPVGRALSDAAPEDDPEAASERVWGTVPEEDVYTEALSVGVADPCASTGACTVVHVLPKSTYVCDAPVRGAVNTSLRSGRSARSSAPSMRKPQQSWRLVNMTWDTAKGAPRSTSHHSSTL
jgi:hypothetical protein